jgi:hypothetical protein
MILWPLHRLPVESLAEVLGVILCQRLKARWKAAGSEKGDFGADGRPVHGRGVVRSTPGLYFLGLHFLYSMSSATLAGIERQLIVEQTPTDTLVEHG